MIGKTLRSLRIVSEIGQGGMGVVYLAEHVALPKRFAIKSLSKAFSRDPNFHERFYREAQKQALLDSPYIVQVTDFFEDDGQYFLVMEFVDGQDLSQLIKSRGKLSPSEAITIFRDVLTGLKFAHDKGIVHRDMKPSNVLIDKSGRARIMDFGIAIMAGAVEKRLTAAGATIGSPWYMSPEQITRRGDDTIDKRTDIYALGIVLFEMLTGDIPFDGDTAFSIQEQQVKSPAPDPRQKSPEISEALARIVLKAMAKNPDERFQSCGEFLQALEALEKTEFGGKSKALLRALLTAIVVGAGIILYLYTRPPEIIERSPVEVEHKSAYNLIQSGSEKAWFACTQLKQLALKQKGLESAKLIADTNLEEQIKKQIGDHKKNIDSALIDYTTFLDQLAKVNSEIVASEFDEYSRFLESRQSFQQIRIARLMKRHYERRPGGNQGISIGRMAADCETALGGGT
jgi:serine/threonine protein kinase